MFVLLHWWNNVIVKKKIPPLPQHPPPEPHTAEIFLISIIEKKINENYVEFDFIRGTVLVFFLFYGWITIY